MKIINHWTIGEGFCHSLTIDGTSVSVNTFGVHQQVGYMTIGLRVIFDLMKVVTLVIRTIMPII